MNPIEERAQDQQFWAFPAVETIEHIWQRIERLISTGRRMIWTDHYLSSPEITIETGLRVNTDAPRGGAYFQRSEGTAALKVLMTPGIRQLTIAGFASDGSEKDEAHRFYEKREGTRVYIEGFGQGRSDHIQVTYYNRYQVGSVTTLHFDFEDSPERAEREGAFLDGLAAHGDWSAARLAKLAETARYEWKLALDLAARVHDA